MDVWSLGALLYEIVEHRPLVARGASGTSDAAVGPDCERWRSPRGNQLVIQCRGVRAAAPAFAPLLVTVDLSDAEEHTQLGRELFHCFSNGAALGLQHMEGDAATSARSFVLAPPCASRNVCLIACVQTVLRGDHDDVVEPNMKRTSLKQKERVKLQAEAKSVARAGVGRAADVL